MRPYLIIALSCFYSALIVTSLTVYRWYRGLKKPERIALDREISPW